jgi:hypothetical protein
VSAMVKAMKICRFKRLPVQVCGGHCYRAWSNALRAQRHRCRMWFVAVVMLDHGAVHAAPLDAPRAEDAIHAGVRRMATWPAESEQRDSRALTCRGITR